MKSPAFTIISQCKYPVKVTYAKSTKKGAKRYSKSLYCKVTVKDYILKSVKQTKIDQIEMAYAGNVPEITKDDVVITRTSDNQRIYTKAVTNNKTDKKLVIDTVLPMTDSKEFTVACKDSTFKFTATDGVVAQLGVDPTQIVYNTATEIDLVALDSQNVELARYAYGSNDIITNGYKFDISVTSDKGYFVSDSKLILNKVGDTASFTAEKHSGKYENGVEVGVLKLEGTITAIDKTASTNTDRWTLTDVNPYDWSKIKENHELILDEDSNLFINVTDEKGNKVFSGDPTANNYSVVSTNEDVIYVKNGTNTLVPRKEGSAIVNVKDTNGNIVFAYSITVKPAAKPVSFTVSNNGSVSVSNAAAVDDQAEIELVVKDQYGRDYVKNDYHYEFTNTVAHNDAVTTDTPGTPDTTNVFGKNPTRTGAKSVMTFKGKNNTKGSYSWKVELKNSANATVYTTVVSAKVLAPDMNATPTYALLLDGKNASKTVDTTVTTSNYTETLAVSIKVGAYYNGVLGAYVTPDEVKITLPNATVVDPDAIDTKSFSYTFRNTVGKLYNKKSQGTYVVSVKVTPAGTDILKTIKQNIYVKDSQTGLLKVTKRDAVNVTEAADLQEAVYKAFDFSYDNKALTKEAGKTVKDGKIVKTDITATKDNAKSETKNGVNNDYLPVITVTVPVVIGDIYNTDNVATADGEITDEDVIYLTETVTTGYFLQWK